MKRRWSPLVLFFVAASAAAQVGVYVTTPMIDPGLPFEIAVAIRNESGAGLHNVTAVVQLPPGVQVTGLPSICSQSAQTVTCLIADLPYVLTLPQKTFGITAVADDSTNGTVLPLTIDVRAEDGHPITNASAEALVFRTTFVTQTTPDALAAAMNEVNAKCTDEYPCKIAFRLGTPPASGYFTFKPAAALPKITGKDVSIDGTTQTRLTGDTNPNGPEIFVDGSDNAWEDAFVFDHPCSAEVAGLAVGNFKNAAVSMYGVQFVFAGDPPACKVQRLEFPMAVHDDYLGVDPTGTHAAPNGRGVVFSGRFESFTKVSNNLISGNHRSGIWMAFAFGVSISGNSIGLDIHNQPLGNGASGIYVGQRTVQTDIRGNYVAFNHDFGIAVDRTAQGTDIGPSSIFANAQMGIDVGLDGPTPDIDVPAPVINSVQYDPATNKTVIDVSSHDPGRVIMPVLTIYASDAPHSSGYGDGQYLLGTFLLPGESIRFAANGDWRGKWVAATVTRNWTILPKGAATPSSEYPDVVSTTSEFSRAVKVE